MNDLISRQDAIDKAILVPIAKIVTEDRIIYRKVVFVDDIEKLPSAERTGEWIEGQTAGQRFVKCSRCGHIEFDGTPNYCEDCGARMVSDNGKLEK